MGSDMSGSHMARCRTKTIAAVMVVIHIVSVCPTIVIIVEYFEPVRIWHAVHMWCQRRYCLHIVLKRLIRSMVLHGRALLSIKK